MSVHTCLFAAALASFAACGEPLPPIVRFDMSPAYLCQGVDDQEVRLDATGSLAADGGPADGLTYAWSFSFAPTAFETGSASDDRLILRFAGERPVRIRLQVSDADGVSASQTETLGLTLAQLQACGTGCAAHETCTTVSGRQVCVGAEACSNDDACAPCLRCVADDGGTRRCLP